MLFDVLTGIEELKICVSYALDGNIINTIPSTLDEYERCIPNYITLPTWQEDITNIKDFSKLPLEAKNYVKVIEKYTGISVDMISVGAERNQTIIRKQIFNK